MHYVNIVMDEQYNTCVARVHSFAGKFVHANCMCVRTSTSSDFFNFLSIFSSAHTHNHTYVQENSFKSISKQLFLKNTNKSMEIVFCFFF